MAWFNPSYHLGHLWFYSTQKIPQIKVDNYFDIEQAIPNPNGSLYETSPDRNKFLSNFNTRWCEPLTAFFSPLSDSWDRSTNAPDKLTFLHIYTYLQSS